MKSTRKKFSKEVAFALLLGGMTFVSCGSDEFTKGNAEDALEDYTFLLSENNPICTKELKTGYYEINRYEANYLRKLAKAGVVTCNFDVVKEKVTSYSYDGWDRQEYSTDNYHLFASVELTKEGEKYVVKDDLKDQVRKDYSKLVEDIQKSMSSELKVPEYANLPDTAFFPTDSIVGDGNYAGGENNFKADNDEPEESSEYQKALKKVSSKVVKVRTNKVELVDVFDVYSDEEMQKAKEGKCKFVVRVSGYTPFEWAYRKSLEEENGIFVGTFKKYEDKGWVVESVNPIDAEKVFGVDIKPLSKDEDK